MNKDSESVSFIAGRNNLIYIYTHTHAHTPYLTLAGLRLLDDSQLVVDEHRRAEVPLEGSRLMDDRRNPDYTHAGVERFH